MLDLVSGRAGRVSLERPMFAKKLSRPSSRSRVFFVVYYHYAGGEKTDLYRDDKWIDVKKNE